jgi:hypothetical protein
MEIDSKDLADYLTGGQFDEDYYYNSKKKELSRDTRINKDKFIDVDAAYKDLKRWEGSREYHDTEIAKDLLSSFEVNASDLTKTLKQKYHMNEGRCSNILNNLANQKDVSVRLGTFDKMVKLKRK